LQISSQRLHALERQLTLSRPGVLDTKCQPPQDQRECERSYPQCREKRLPAAINCCAMLGLDDFGAIKHQYGRAAAAAALLHFSSKLLQHIRQSDTLARLSDDAFMLLLPHTRFIQAFDLIEQLRRIVLASPFKCESVHLALRFSAGITEQAPHEHLSDTLTRAATALQRTRTKTSIGARPCTHWQADSRTGT
jgi:diguanylate cyclase (GGDEF)-like protein